jgi:hypothetical protein
MQTPQYHSCRLLHLSQYRHHSTITADCYTFLNTDTTIPQLQTATPFPLRINVHRIRVFLLQLRDVCGKRKQKKKRVREIWRIKWNIFLSSRTRRREDFVTLRVILTTVSQFIRSSLFHTLSTLSSSRNRDRGLGQVFEDVPVWSPNRWQAPYKTRKANYGITYWNNVSLDDSPGSPLRSIVICLTHETHLFCCSGCKEWLARWWNTNDSF